MLQQLSMLWRYTFGKPDDPIFEKERSSWAYFDILKKLNQGCLPAMAVLIALTVFGCAAFSVLVEPNAYLILSATVLGLLLSATLIDWATGWAATALTATTISSEIESETIDALRATNRTPQQIVYAKYGAAIHRLHLPLFVPVGLRILAIITAVVTALLALTLETSILASSIETILQDLAQLVLPLAPAAFIVLACLSLLLLALSLLSLVVSPVLQILLFGAIGMFGSTLAKTRSNGILAAIGIRIGFGALVYVVSQVISFTLLFGLQGASLVFGNLPGSGQVLSNAAIDLYLFSVTAVSGVSTLVIFAFQLGMIWGFLRLASDRVKKLAV